MKQYTFLTGIALAFTLALGACSKKPQVTSAIEEPSPILIRVRTAESHSRIVTEAGNAREISVPRIAARAVVKRGQAEVIFVIDEDRVRMRLVKTGQKFDDEVEVLSGLEVNERVAVENTEQLVDGQRVEIQNR